MGVYRLTNRAGLFWSITDHAVEETREISANIYIDFDVHGNLVSMTIEPAHETAHFQEIAYQQIDKQTGQVAFFAIYWDEAFSSSRSVFIMTVAQRKEQRDQIYF